jgi:hypothetical protein
MTHAMAKPAEVESTLPREDAPEFGTIRLCGLLVSEVAYWFEDGDHVFRSMEFDLYAADSDRDVAIRKFIDNADDFAEALVDWDSEGSATPEEVGAARTLLSRLTAGYRAVSNKLEAEREERERHLIRVNLRRRRRRGVRVRGWYQRSPLASSSQRQPV